MFKVETSLYFEHPLILYLSQTIKCNKIFLKGGVNKMNNQKLVKEMFKLLFNIRNINISFYDAIQNSLINHIYVDNADISPLNNFPSHLLKETYINSEIIKVNFIENYLLVPCNTSSISGVFIWGPFTTEAFDSSMIHKIIISNSISPHKYTFVSEYIRTLPFLPLDEINYLKLSTLGIASLTLTDIQSPTHNMPSKNSRHIKDSGSEGISLLDFWQKNLEFIDLKESKKFYHDLFKSQTHEERLHVLESYFYISKSFDYISLAKDIDHLSSLRTVLYVILGVTMSTALQYGLDSPSAMKLILNHGSKFNSCKTIDELILCRNLMFLDFASKTHTATVKPYSKLVNQCISFILDNITSKLTVSSIAQHFGYSTSYLSSLFKKETGSSIKSFILRRKIEIAKSLLTSSNISIGDLSDYLSFSSYNHFSISFKKLTGINPKNYAQK